MSSDLSAALSKHGCKANYTTVELPKSAAAAGHVQFCTHFFSKKAAVTIITVCKHSVQRQM